MSPVLFVVGESAWQRDWVEYDSATYVFESLDEIRSYFEPWYVEIPHLILDNEGHAYRLISDGPGLRAEGVGSSEQFKQQFRHALTKLIAGRPEDFKIALGVGVGVGESVDDRTLDRILADPACRKLLAS